MAAATPSPRPALRLVQGGRGASAPAEWSWFCGHCAAPSPRGEPPFPEARVCPSCGLGVLLETRKDVLPGSGEAFLVVDSAMSVQAMSGTAETLLNVTEESAVRRPVVELLVPADAEMERSGSFALAIAEATGGSDNPVHVFVRPWNTFGVRMRARIAPCGPPRAALLVLEATRPGDLRPVQH